MKVDRICKTCSIKFQADHWEIQRNRAKFCSPHCKHEWMSEEYRGRKLKKKAADAKRG